ncbi:putative membrane protein [Tenacibaculum litopenaei]|uniref:hypothetical protein n=1 Tax=Tenacibaculum litopenaei TaxID=396016 RepID=UPI003892D9D6
MKKVNYLLIALMSITLTSCWQFNRDQAEKDAESKGRQILLEAESSKKAMIEEAKAENEAASLKAEAQVKIAKAQAQVEIERAKGVAEANRIIGQSLKGNDEYLKYLMIQGLNEGKGERIYIPTEAGLPILEANK